MARVPRTDAVKVTEALATGISVDPINAEVTSLALDVRDSSQIAVDTDFVRGGTATAVVFDVEESDDGSTGWSVVQKQDAAGALTPLQLTRTTSASGRFTFPLDVTPFQFVRLKINGTTATAADTVTVTANKTRGD